MDSECNGQYGHRSTRRQSTFRKSYEIGRGHFAAKFGLTFVSQKFLVVSVASSSKESSVFNLSSFEEPWWIIFFQASAGMSVVFVHGLFPEVLPAKLQNQSLLLEAAPKAMLHVAVLQHSRKHVQ